MTMMMNQTSSKNLLLCLLLYLIREDGKDDKDEVKTIHRSACPLVSPKARFCVLSDDCAADDSEKMLMYGRVLVVFLPLCVYLKSHIRGQAKNRSRNFNFLLFRLLLLFFFFRLFSFFCFLVKKFISTQKRGENEMKRMLKQLLDNSKSSISLTSSRFSEVVLRVGGFCRTTTATPTTVAARGVSSAFTTRSSSRDGKNPSRLLRRRRRFRRSMGTTMKLQTPRVVHQRRKTSTRPNSIRTRK